MNPEAFDFILAIAVAYNAFVIHMLPPTDGQARGQAMMYYTIFHPLFGVTETGIWRKQGDPLYQKMIARLDRAEYNGERIYLEGV